MGENHFALKYINLSTEEYTAINAIRQNTTAERNTNCIILEPTTVDALITRASLLLTSNNWAEIAAGLAVLTGRRSTEILATATFTPKTTYSVTFTLSTQTKRRNADLIV